jgi:hypothetical protein
MGIRSAREIYPGLTDRFAYGPGDYSPIIESFGDVLLRVDDWDGVDSDISGGDSRILYRNGDRYGILVFGWGSCSGCDALAGCGSLAEIDDLVEELAAKIEWGKIGEILGFLKEHDWEGDYSWSKEETRSFVAEAKAILSEFIRNL